MARWVGTGMTIKGSALQRLGMGRIVPGASPTLWSDWVWIASSAWCPDTKLGRPDSGSIFWPIESLSYPFIYKLIHFFYLFSLGASMDASTTMVPTKAWAPRRPPPLSWPTPASSSIVTAGDRCRACRGQTLHQVSRTPPWPPRAPPTLS
jgi:hypothetical protein